MVLVLAPVLTFVFAASTWDVSPTPLDQMQEAGVSISVDAISKILADPKQDVQLRYWAAMALGQLADKSAIPALVASLSDSDPNDRIGAAGALMYLPDEGIVQVLCETAVHDGNSGPRHSATTSLSAITTDEATKCLVRVAGNEQETKKIRLQSLIILEQQIQERKGFEELIPTLGDLDPDVKGMAGIILSIEYIDEPEVLESLSVTESLVDAALDAGLDSWIYRRIVRRLELIAEREFIRESHDASELQIPGVRADINNRITEWAAETFD